MDDDVRWMLWSVIGEACAAVIVPPRDAAPAA